MLPAIEGGTLTHAMLRRFQVYVRDGSGCLSWSDGKLARFAIGVFKEQDLTPPTEEQVYQVYSRFDIEQRGHLDARECLCLMDALLRSIFVTHAQSVAAEAPSPADSRLAAAEEWVERYAQTMPPVDAASSLTYQGTISVDLDQFAALPSESCCITMNGTQDRCRTLAALENGSFAREALRIFRAHDKQSHGLLPWGDSREIYDYIATLFGHHGLASPTEGRIRHMCQLFHADDKPEGLDACMCLCMADALARAVLHGQPTEERPCQDVQAPRLSLSRAPAAASLRTAESVDLSSSQEESHVLKGDWNPNGLTEATPAPSQTAWGSLAEAAWHVRSGNVATAGLAEPTTVANAATLEVPNTGNILAPPPLLPGRSSAVPSLLYAAG